MSDPNFKTIAPLAAYIERIGAEELNFRRFMVKEHRGEYYTERSLIVLLPDGGIRCTNKEHAPTEQEAREIKEALLKEKFPRSIGATESKLKDLQELCGKNSILYSFLNYKGEIVMVQERVIYKGKKLYVPWTFWSDGVWRKMEPEGALPFWKPRAQKLLPKIMIHEGAKAAEAVHRLISEGGEKARSHPWWDELSSYEHWGMIGGALAPHRADYSELTREKPAEVVYICDNDFLGKSALAAVSRCYGQAMKGVMFDGRWPHSWDMADQMPKQFFTKVGRYVGPSLAELMVSATCATETVPNSSGKGRSLTIVRPSFVEEWYHSVTPEVFVHRDWPNRIWTAQEFNNTVRPFSDVDDTARLLKGDAASKSAVLKYSPANVPGIYGSGDSGRYINTHSPSGIKAEQGDYSPWINFMENLVPDDGDRYELHRWCATLIARPEVKMLYGVLMISETQGVGKGTLGERILAPLVGQPNVSFPSEKEIVDSNYNYWLAHKRLAVVHEIYAGHSSKAYNNLKSIITDRYLTVSKKYQANYEIENWIHIYACSNSMRALQLTMDDRRWYVPKVSERKRSPGYWAELNRWLTDDGGLSIIKGWAEDFCERHGAAQRGDDAPWSELKKEIVEENWSPGMVIAGRLFDRLRRIIDGENPDLRTKLEGFGQLRGDEMVVADEDVVEFIKNKLYDGRQSDRLERPLTIRKVAKAKQWFVAEGRIHSSVNIRKQIVGNRLLCSTRDLSLQKSVDLFGTQVEKERRLLPVDLTLFTEL